MHLTDSSAVPVRLWLQVKLFLDAQWEDGRTADTQAAESEHGLQSGGCLLNCTICAYFSDSLRALDLLSSLFRYL